MADITKTLAAKNAITPITTTAGASSQTIVVGKDTRMAIYITNGGGAAITATVVKGNGICAAQGDLAVSVPNTSAPQLIGPLESARFVDTSTGKITLTLSGTTSVNVGVIQL